MADNKVLVDFVSMVEQMEQQTVQIAIIVGSYRKALLDNDVPLDEARVLTRDYHMQLWAAAFTRGRRDD